MPELNPRRQVRRVLIITLLLNLCVATGKIIVGSISGALAITADGFHSLTDAASNIIGLVANHIAAQPPDDKHPYGHRRFETLAALLIGVFLVLVAWEIIQRAIRGLQTDAEPALTPLTFAVLAGTLLVNIAVSSYQIRQGKRLNSELLLADAANTRADVFVTLSVLVSMVIIALTGWGWVDAVAALFVVLLIGRAAWRIIRQTGRVLVDTAPYTPETLQTLLEGIPNVQQIVRARSRGTTDAAHIDIDVQVAPAMTAEQSAAITEVIRSRLEVELQGVMEIEVHYMPDDSGERDYAMAVRAVADTLGLTTHEVNVIASETRKIMELHVEVPPEQTLTQAHALVSQLEAGIQQRLPEIAEVVTHIEPAQTPSTYTEGEQAHYYAQTQQQIMRLLRERHPRVDWHDLRVYRTDTEVILTIHAALLPETSVEAAHQLCERAETLLRMHFPQLNRVTIHTEPHDHTG